MNFSDMDLVDRLNHDDRYAFDELYNRYWRDLYTAAFYIIKDQDAAMDLCQDIFIWIWQRRGNLRIQNMRAYLKTAMKYKAANFIRHGKVKESFFTKIESLGELEPAENDELEVKELRQMIREFAKGLPERCGQIFQMSRFEELSNKEIASKMAISEKTVENQLTLALKKLKISLGRIYILFFFI
ncbi:MAG TPA: RNA polymerase sigma-70 factor [Pedobacter sp.]